MTRRHLLTQAIGLGGSAFLVRPRTLDASSSREGGVSQTACADPLAGAILLGTVPFTGEGGPLDAVFGSGLDGRLYTDLSTLGPRELITPNARHYVRTRHPDTIDPRAPWTIAVSGLVRRPVRLTLDMLAPKVSTPLGPYVMECAGNGAFAAFGMLSASSWSGVPIADVLAMVDVLPRATRVLVSGVDDHGPRRSATSMPGASWIFTIAELERAGAFLATAMNGAPLSPDHGFPIRLVVPNWYGCACIKWVDSIAFLDDDAPATSQMREFASRTHQDGVPALARDYRPATIELAAMPVRVEKWRSAGTIVYRVVGIMWGGYRVTDALSIRFTPGRTSERVAVCPEPRTNQPWTLWSHPWRPRFVGAHAITLAVDDPSIPTRRLDAGFYRRTIDIHEI